MKKVLALSLFAMAALVSQAWAAYEVCTGSYAGYCKWGKTDTACDPISIDPGASWSKATCKEAYDNCITNGYHYTDDACKTWSGKGNNPNETFGCCKWKTEGGKCYEVKTETEKNDCQQGTNVYWSSNCGSKASDGESFVCPSGTPTYDGENPANGYCCWEGNEYNNGQGACEVIAGEVTVAKCTADGGSQVSSCSGCRINGTPIIKFTPASQALIVAPFARSLHISSIKDATVSLYDMSGAKVYSGKVRAGNSVFSLEKVASGSYYAIVQSGSDAKKIPVILK